MLNILPSIRTKLRTSDTFRNSVLGDTFVRILRANGKRVEMQNYIDNTGVQVADVVVGFIYLLKMNLTDIVVLAERLESEGESFDYYCWDLYARVGQEYLQNEELKAKRAEVLHLIEEGNNETAKLADFVATKNVHCILNTMERFRFATICFRVNRKFCICIFGKKRLKNERTWRY